SGFLFLGCATTQDMIFVNQRILRQEQKLEKLEDSTKELAKFEVKLQNFLNQMADLEVRINHDHEQLLTLEARIEDYRQLVNRSIDDSERGNEGLSMKFEAMQERIQQISKELKDFQKFKSNMISQTEPPEELDEEALYDLAYNAFKKGEFDKAQELLTTFLEKFPKGKFSDNARFWIGECFYRKNQFEEAIMEYEKVKNDYPSGDKVPPALFKQALSFLKLNKKDEAGIILKHLIQHYPKSEQAGMAKEQLESLN
ncbi:MAG: tol-pal system protein YbgF, partial [bacterium]